MKKRNSLTSTLMGILFTTTTGCSVNPIPTDFQKKISDAEANSSNSQTALIKSSDFSNPKFKMSAKEAVQEFQANPASFDKYENQVVEIDGQIMNMGEKLLSDDAYDIIIGSDVKGTLRCEIPSPTQDSKEAERKLKVGQSITVRAVLVTLPTRLIGCKVFATT